ncbi:MAG: DUF1002 domain-containing protein [Coriobacteriales bacterium]
MKHGILTRIAACALAAALAVGLFPAAALADSQEIVTLGADLSAEQKAQVLEFFGLSEDELASRELITVTNADEHRYCDASIPSSVTGSRTLSCSYIQPTTSGGIHVQTANLTYVTATSLYNALQTAGVQNCNLVVTAPFEVSGTGALTGVFMAYESEGVTLDAAKQELAVEEMYTTAGLQEQYGDEIANAISEVKDQLVSSAKDMTKDQIAQLVRDTAARYGITLTDEDVANLAAFLLKMQSMDYDVSAFATTLDDMKTALGEMGDQAGGVLAALGKFFQGIMSFFSGLFGSDAASSAASAAGEAAGSIFDQLDTSVFALDN